MEQAIFITKTDNLKYVNSKYSRLYFGNEFCERLFSSPEDLKIISDFVLEHRMNFSLVTPFLTNAGIKALKPYLEYTAANFSSPEVIVNDWGMLKLLRDEFSKIQPVLGRLLTKQKRGPRILNIKDKTPKAMLAHFRGSNIDVPALRDFLINKGVHRIELDNLLQGIERESPLLSASLYLPFAYITTTRFCLSVSFRGKNRPLRSISSCSKECQSFTFKLCHKDMPSDIFLKGNTQFFRNDRLPDNLNSLKIDRIVYEPEIPI